MGRTVLPYSQVWEEERSRWLKFRRALRKEDQVHLDRLFEQARLHLQAGVYASNLWPLEIHASVHAPGTPEGPERPDGAPAASGTAFAGRAGGRFLQGVPHPPLK
jgi:hypothetical protein